MHFEWDPAKDRANQAKHELSFAQASRVFDDECALEIHDSEHSETENRFIALSHTPDGLLAVVFTEPQDDVIRIISARHVTRKERQRFETYWRGRP